MTTTPTTMTKIRAFYMLKQHLEEQLTAQVKAYSSPAPLEEPAKQHLIQQVGLHTLLAHEVQQHLLRLHYLLEACHYAETGTQPPTYDELLPYDPYQAMHACLTGETTGVASHPLSAELQTYVDQLPPITCDSILSQGGWCSMPEHTEGAFACGQAQLGKLADYPQHLQHLHELIAQRAELAQIRSLL
ncbi:hypothetical protein [Hymenobacter defluvii]|uniref:DinB family protein n=1 Tax=Hymenobacter defluvii TaxID=2054411 RepID=A0ABS3THT0_9BACT|nr:hypothetical protein [Hymenobacter defluvii]MBO3273212.1 hypothetical protein [Hymenobacter defluvii]